MKLRSYKNYIFIFMGAFLLLISAFTMKVEAKENSYKTEIQGSDENTCLVFKGKCTYKFGLKKYNGKIKHILYKKTNSGKKKIVAKFNLRYEDNNFISALSMKYYKNGNLYFIASETEDTEFCSINLKTGKLNQIFAGGLLQTDICDNYIILYDEGMDLMPRSIYMYDIKKDWVTEIIHSAVDVHVDTKNKKIIYTQIIDRESMEMNMKYRVYQVDFHGKNKKILCKNVTAMYINEFEENGIKYEYLINEKPYKSIEKELYWN